MPVGDARDREDGSAIWWIAAATSVLPTLATFGAHAISEHFGTIEPGTPILDGSASISRSARHEPAIHVFRALLLPSAALMAVTWWLVHAWLRTLGTSRVARRTVLVLGFAGALFLVLYATYLGTDGAFYRLLRRYGVYVFFGGTGLAQLALVVTLRRSRAALLADRSALRRIRVMTGTVALMLALGPLQIALDALLDGDVGANVLEWWFALLLMTHFGALADLWRIQGTEVRLAHRAVPLTPRAMGEAPDRRDST
ncbi:MAG: hypothetical protein AAGB93_16960 [Planctomycetota bacterium]